MTGLLVLGNQLFDPKLLAKQKIEHVFMREDIELCTYFKFHKLKIHILLSAMRTYAEELKDAGYTVTYQKLSESPMLYEEHLTLWLKKYSLGKLLCFEIEDKFFEERIIRVAEKASVELEFIPSPMFLTSRLLFRSYLSKTSKPFMQTFYKAQRKRLNILIDKAGEPLGGQWSFDELNRKPLPKTVHPPKMPTFDPQSDLSRSVTALFTEHFKTHPGDVSNVWLPVDRAGASKWFREFLVTRLENFGPYEDALTEKSDLVFHSALTPFLNTGLLTPADVTEGVLREMKKRKLPLSSVEGFLRQVIGWREFVRGIYQNFSEVQERTNFWGHQRQLNEHWYQATTGIPPLDHLIDKANRLGYAHHIERLMVAGNLMLLLEINPREAHRWFMEMFIDSSDWVMGPNVYGMGIFSDGGIFATKPYICGSNYYRKMGGFSKGDWCAAVDGLYWGFVEKHENYFLKNPRLSMIARSVQKMDSGRKKAIYAAAADLRNKITSPPLGE